MSKKLKLYPSSMGFYTDKGVEIDYNSACLRYLSVSKNRVKKDIDPKYQKIGAVHEIWYAKVLGPRIAHKELPIKVDLTDDVLYSGRKDFVLLNGEIHETKASLSKNFLYQVIRKKKFKISHLAQLVSYMIHSEESTGAIVAGFYKEKNGNYMLQEHVKFKVVIDNIGNILVENEKTGFTVKHVLEYQQQAVKALIEEKVPERPVNSFAFMGPCRFCPLNNLCSTYDKGQIPDTEYKKQGLEILKGENK